MGSIYANTKHSFCTFWNYLEKQILQLNLPRTPFIRIALWDMLSSVLCFSTGFRLMPKLVLSNIKSKGKEGHRKNNQIM